MSIREIIQQVSFETGAPTWALYLAGFIVGVLEKGEYQVAYTDAYEARQRPKSDGSSPGFSGNHQLASTLTTFRRIA